MKAVFALLFVLTACATSPQPVGYQEAKAPPPGTFGNSKLPARTESSPERYCTSAKNCPSGSPVPAAIPIPVR